MVEYLPSVCTESYTAAPPKQHGNLGKNCERRIIQYWQRSWQATDSLWEWNGWTSVWNIKVPCWSYTEQKNLARLWLQNTLLLSWWNCLFMQCRCCGMRARVYACSNVGVYMCGGAYVHVCACGGQMLMLSTFLYCFSLCMLCQALSLNVGLLGSASTASQLVQETPVQPS